MIFFHANGFLVIPKVLTPEKCEFLRNDLDEIFKETEGENYHPSKKMMKQRVFENSPHNLDLFALEPIVTFAEHLIGGANGMGYSIDDGIPNANIFMLSTIIHLPNFSV